MTIKPSPSDLTAVHQPKPAEPRFESGLLDYCDECGEMSVLHGADFDFMMESRRNLCAKCWYPS